MRTFSDKSGAEWKLDLTMGAILRVKTLSECRFDLLKPEQKIKHPDFDDPVPLQALLMLDYPSLWEVLYMVIEPEAKQRGVSAEQFGELMSSNCLTKAKSVFREEWRDFFHGLQRTDQALALEKIGQWLIAAESKLENAMQDPRLKELDKRVMDQMDLSLKTTSGKLEAFLESTPGPTHGAT